MFGQGRGVAQRNVEAARWYRKGNDKEYAQALYKLDITFPTATAWRRAT
jgi:TPR repeat protein